MMPVSSRSAATVTGVGSPTNPRKRTLASSPAAERRRPHRHRAALPVQRRKERQPLHVIPVIVRQHDRDIRDLVECLHYRAARTNQRLSLLSIDRHHDHLVLDRYVYLAVQAEGSHQTVEKLLNHWSLLMRIGCAHPCLSLSWYPGRTALIVTGHLLAVPIMVVLKIFCDHSEPLAPIGEFLGD